MTEQQDKIKQKFINMYISDTHAKYQEELSDSLRWPKPHLKCHLQLKTKEKMMERQCEVSRKSSLNYTRVGFVMQMSFFLKTVLQQDSTVIQSHPSFSGTERQTPLQRDVSFISVNVPHKRVTSTLSSGFLLCLFLKSRINSQQSFCQRALFWSDTLCYLSLYFCIVEMFLKIYRK